MTDRGRSIEEQFNFAMGEALRDTTARWRASPGLILVEQTGVLSGRGNTGRRPDILVLDHHTPPVVVECSFDEADADRDAAARLGARVRIGRLQIRTAVSVHIPEPFRARELRSAIEALKNGARIRYALHQLVSDPGSGPAPGSFRRWPATGFLEGAVYDLAALLSAAALPKEDIERVADEIARLVNEAADGLEAALPETTKRAIAERVHQRSFLKGLRTTMVLWLNALLTQQRLHGQEVVYAHPLDFTGRGLPLPSEQIAVWRRIQRENWRAIFDPAIEVLEIAGNSSPRATGEALAALTRAVEKIESARLGLHINVGAELFPKLSEDRKQAAAFYTQPATAELLAGLTLRQGDLPDEERADGALFANRSLADLACGTGTLLRAGYRRVAAFHERAGGTMDSVAALHRAAMESGLVGTDISPIAAHLTSSSLAAVGTGEPYGDTRIGWVRVGGATAAVGSLEYLRSARVADLFQSLAGRSTGNGEIDSSVEVRERSVDWILMNPPYSRTRGGQSAFDVAVLSDEERKSCQKRWGVLTKGEPVNRRAGMAASFLALARKKIKRGGRIGFVLPLTAAFAESWAMTRSMIEREFEDIVAVAVAAGQALGRDAFSADTGMEEMLLVGNAAPPPRPGRRNIRLITLKRPVNRVGEAGEIARAILATLEDAVGDGSIHPIVAGSEEIGQVCVFEVSGDGAPWGPLGAAHMGLALATEALAGGRLEFSDFSESLRVEMSVIGDVFEVGPTHDRIGHPAEGDGRGAFRFHPVTGPNDALGDDRALWAADSTAQRRLLVSPTHKGSAPSSVGSEAQREAMRRYRSTLHYARNMRWTSQALLTAATERPVMGGRTWTALLHDDETVRKAFALWTNSILGMMVHWTQGQRTQTGRSTTQIAALHRIPCPRLDRLPEAALRRAAARFDDLAARELLPACQAHADPARIAIDDAVRDMFGFSDEAASVMAALRRLWCSEPSVHGRNRKALALLGDENED